MPSVLAIVSKAVFEKQARGLGSGDVWQTSSYASQHKTFEQLNAEGDLFLVTVRPPGRLCLVAVLERPTHSAAGWSAAPNRVPIRDIHEVRDQLTFVGGAALPNDVAKLGMSLQTPRVLTDEAVALLRKGQAPTKAPAPTKSPTEKVKVQATPAKTTTPPPLRSKSAASGNTVEQALKSGNAEAALSAMLSLWKTSPSAELSALITSTSNAARVEVPDIGGKKKALATWAAAARRATELEKPAILDRLADAASRDAMVRLDLVAKWLPDPRVDDLFVRLLETPPYTSTGARVFFTRLFALMEQFSDPSLLPRLAAADAKLKRLTSDMEWHRGKLAKLLASISPRLEALPPAPEFAALGGAVKKPDASTSSTTAGLLEAVYEDPSSDSARAVYADALSNAGDPRGEFITVQLGLAKNPADAALKKREKQLLAAHGLQWLGPLAQFVKTRHRYERGFLAEAIIDFRLSERAAELVGLPIWSTVHTFDGPGTIGLHEVMRSLRSLGFSLYSDGSITELLGGKERPIEVLRLTGHHPLVLKCKALPKLRDLTIDADLKLLADLVKAPVVKQLERLSLSFWVSGSGNDISEWVDTLGPAAASASVSELQIMPRPYDMQQRYQLFRGPSGYTRAVLEVGPDRHVGNDVWSREMVDLALALLRRLPKLERVEVKLRKHTSASDRAAMEAGLERLKLEQVTFL